MNHLQGDVRFDARISRRRLLQGMGVSLGGVFLGGCGYRVASKNRVALPFRSIAVRPLENETTTYEVEQILTQALVAELVKRSELSVYSEEERAEAVLIGVIRRVTASPVTFAQSAFASTFLVTVYVQIEVRERETGKLLFSEPDYIFREEYIVNSDVEMFFSEANPALTRVGRDFAGVVVAALLEDF